MFIVLLRFSKAKSRARELMAAHNAWLERGFDDQVFLIAGSLDHGAGGAVLAHNTTRAELEERVQRDPFVVHDVVRAELLEVSPSKADARLGFLLA
ncbi:MAG TPA: YciI family protein [Polyangiaceae bacterium]